ncbi:MAG: hypothetical protein V3V67_04915 [Myxococcota bacterium]
MTCDQNLEHQQSLSGIHLGVVVLAARSNRFDDLRSLVPRLLDALEMLEVGQVVRITAQED